MRVLFIGDAWLGSNARSLANGFRLAGHEVLHVDTSSVNLPQRWSADWVFLKASGQRRAQLVENVHQQIEQAYAAFRPQLVFCFKTVHLRQDRLVDLGKTARVHYSADDVSNPYNTTPEYLEYESAWDAVITTKRHNIDELSERGVANPIFVSSAYDPALHHPVARRRVTQYSVGFLGNSRGDRRNLMRDLARRHGAEMVIGGPGWNRDPVLRRSAAHLLPGAYGEDFSYFVASVRANLVLLNSENRDTHTCRSYEVPAAGGLFVGERTPEHEDLLIDGREGYLFDSPAELEAVLERIENSPEEASIVALRGFTKVVSGNNAYSDRAQQILIQGEFV